MTADDRAGSAPGLSRSRHHSSLSQSQAQTAAFAIGDMSLELTAAPGAARLAIARAGSRDVFVVDPSALDAWAGAIARLIDLTPAANPTERAEYRSPFLIDREGRPSIAFEGLVGDDAVTYGMLAVGSAGQISARSVSVETVRAVSEAAIGAIAVARTTPTGDRLDG